MGEKALGNLVPGSAAEYQPSLSASEGAIKKLFAFNLPLEEMKGRGGLQREREKEGKSRPFAARALSPSSSDEYTKSNHAIQVDRPSCTVAAT